jgi:hypothetical protein
MNRFNWDEIFRDAHLSSGPVTSGLTVSKAVPQGARNIWKEDQSVILECARKYGYRILLENSKITVFIKPK